VLHRKCREKGEGCVAEMKTRITTTAATRVSELHTGPTTVHRTQIFYILQGI